MKNTGKICAVISILLSGCTAVSTPQIPAVTYSENRQIKEASRYDQQYIKQETTRAEPGKGRFIKRRIAVARFGDAAMAEKSPFMPLPEIVKKEKGKVVTLKYTTKEEPYASFTADLIDALYKTNKFIIVERQDINNILNEQEFTKSGYVRKESTAKLNDLLGVEWLITGVVSGEGGKSAANIRIYDVRTGKITVASRVIGANNHEAVGKLVSLISGSIEQLPWVAKITSVDNDKVYINSGKDQGIEEFDKFEVFSVVEEIIDPNEGEIVGYKEVSAGIVTVKEVKDKYSIAKVVTQNLPFKRGDIVRVPENAVMSHSRE